MTSDITSPGGQPSVFQNLQLNKADLQRFQYLKKNLSVARDKSLCASTECSNEFFELQTRFILLNEKVKFARYRLKSAIGNPVG